MTDVRFRATEDGGEIDFENGQAVMSDGLETAIYLSLWGGNDGDDGSDATAPKQWWGNLDETNEQRLYRSETQSLLSSLPATSSNLQLLQRAVQNDLAWLKDLLSQSPLVEVSIPGLNRFSLSVSGQFEESPFRFTFQGDWSTTQ